MPAWASGTRRLDCPPSAPSAPLSHVLFCPPARSGLPSRSERTDDTDMCTPPVHGALISPSSHLDALKPRISSLADIGPSRHAPCQTHRAYAGPEPRRSPHLRRGARCRNSAAPQPGQDADVLRSRRRFPPCAGSATTCCQERRAHPLADLTSSLSRTAHMLLLKRAEGRCCTEATLNF